ncbi:MAG TPA: hypothetical protein VNA25_18245 [Phycisphaerae bacterium]|nr:hypothetical protein [Phycisphaerae bacterium]
MGDHLSKVQSGDPLKIPAATFNSMVDAAAIVKKPLVVYVEEAYEGGGFGLQGVGT